MLEVVAEDLEPHPREQVEERLLGAVWSSAFSEDFDDAVDVEFRAKFLLYIEGGRVSVPPVEVLHRGDAISVDAVATVDLLQEQCPFGGSVGDDGGGDSPVQFARRGFVLADQPHGLLGDGLLRGVVGHARGYHAVGWALPHLRGISHGGGGEGLELETEGGVRLGLRRVE